MTVRIIIGDALARLREMPDDSFDCCVTSPPYWGLRDYGVAGQMGLEPTLGEHIDALVVLFEEVRRVLKPHGSMWLNYGDCYATAPNGRSAEATKAEGGDDRTFRDKPFSTVGPVYVDDYEKTDRVGSGGNKGSLAGAHGGRIVAGGSLKPKDLCMIPNRLAIALQDAGWWVRSEIVWGKPNAMPDSSGAYRPSVAHEKIWLLTKSGDADVWRARDTGELSFAPDLAERCPLVTKPDELGPRWSRIGSWYDADAVMMPPAESSLQRWAQDIESQEGSTRANAGRKTNGNMKAVGGAPRRSSRRVGPKHAEHVETNHRGLDSLGRGEGRLLRSYERDVSPIVPPQVWEIPTASFGDAHFATFPPALVAPCILAGCPRGGHVLDPFGGAGTTGLVADRLGREATLIELNPDYAAMASERLRASLCRVDGGAPAKARHGAGPLFEVGEVAA